MKSKLSMDHHRDVSRILQEIDNRISAVMKIVSDRGSRVRLLDISVSGALLGAEVRLPVGTRAHLRSAITATAFSPDIQVCRHADAASRSSAVGLGAVFTTMDERSRRSLEDFLKKANT